MDQKELEELIIKYQKSYYDGNEEISDSEFDKLWDELSERFPDSEVLKAVGEDSVTGTKRKHLMVVGSQDKFNTEEGLYKWLTNESIIFPVFMEPKYDGCLDYDTILNTDKGNLKIGDIIENNIDCKVKSFNFITNKIEYTDILKKMINQNNYKWYELEDSEGNILKVTENHRVFLPEEHCWREVKYLQEGDKFLIDNE